VGGKARGAESLQAGGVILVDIRTEVTKKVSYRIIKRDRLQIRPATLSANGLSAQPETEGN